MKKDWKREYFSIPNLMGYFRLILIPVYQMESGIMQYQQEFYYCQRSQISLMEKWQEDLT